MKRIRCLFIIALLCCSCHSIKYIPIESVRTEYRDIFLRDSIYWRDSVFVKERGDTLIMEKYSFLYRDKIIRDSIFKNDTIRVPYPIEVVKEVKARLSQWQNFQIGCGRIALTLVFLSIIYFILKFKKVLP